MSTSRLLQVLYRLERRRSLPLAVVLFVIVTAIDHSTGIELSLATMYLVPIMLASWCCGMRIGMAFVALSLASQVALGLTQGLPFSSPIYFVVVVLNRGTAFVMIAILTAGLRSLYERERASARVDLLTGIPNRLQLEDMLARELERHARSGRPLCVAYIDCDGFKGVNDRLGHGQGDRLLQELARILVQHVRAGDLVSRIGGDEFVIVFPDTDGAVLDATLANLRSAWSAECWAEGWPVTLSVGVATFRRPPLTPAAALALADDAMYQAKLQGKDRVVRVVSENGPRPAAAARAGVAP